MKPCIKCGSQERYTRKCGRLGDCKQCSKIGSAKVRGPGGKFGPDYIRNYRFATWKEGLLRSAKGSSKSRGHLPPEIDLAWLGKQLELQGNKCYYTGIVMTPSKTSKSLFQPSLERLDNDIGYTKANTVLVCWGVNIARGRSTIPHLKSWILAIVEKGDPQP